MINNALLIQIFVFVQPPRVINELILVTQNDSEIKMLDKIFRCVDAVFGSGRLLLIKLVVCEFQYLLN